MAKEMNGYIASCSTCAQANTFQLVNPQRPWSHLSIDFLTNLPESEGKTVIMVTMDRFSRFLRLMLLPALPTALETAKLIFNQVFRYYGIPKDIVSDRCPQFISQIWKAFMENL